MRQITHAAAAGETAPLAYSLHYAAPETIAAAQRNERSVTASAAVDMWSLGVMAFELLTSSRAFPPMADDVVPVHDRLLGHAPLPWEGPGSGARIAQLRGLRRSVLQCLSRDPAERPTSREVLGAWNGLFESVTGTTTAHFTLREPPPRR